MTCLFTLLAACAVIAASLLGGCSRQCRQHRGLRCQGPGPDRDRRTAASPPIAGQAGGRPGGVRGAEVERAAGERGARRRQAQRHSRRLRHELGRDLELRLSAGDLCQPQPDRERGGADLDDLAGPGKRLGVGAMAGAAHAERQRRLAGRPRHNRRAARRSGCGGINSATVVANGAVQTQVSVSTAALQALVNSGLAHRHPPRRRQWRGDQHDHQLRRTTS